MTKQELEFAEIDSFVQDIEAVIEKHCEAFKCLQMGYEGKVDVLCIRYPNKEKGVADYGIEYNVTYGKVTPAREWNDRRKGALRSEWQNVYANDFSIGGFSTKEEALAHIQDYDGYPYVKTIKIEWEEEI